MLSFVMLEIAILLCPISYADSRCAECHYPECHNAVCLYAECHHAEWDCADGHSGERRDAWEQWLRF
jgi:hypothetical protein